jgi:two-component system chemotaxis response regulator CheY
MIKITIQELNVLLVEPSQMQGQLVQRMLGQLGVTKVERCATAAEALGHMQGTVPDVVISSLYLQDMPGTELVQAMRQQETLETVPFVLISSETRPQVLDPVRQSGACFILTKPFNEEQLARALGAAADYLTPEAPLDGMEMEIESLRVLLVDDSAMARRHIRRLLTDLGIEKVIEAENGVEAVAALQETMVDLVFTDYNMPEMDGKALVEYIRTQSWQNSVPILMLTSEHDQGRLAAVERAGVSAICDKPFEAKNIRRLIAESLSK